MGFRFFSLGIVLSLFTIDAIAQPQAQGDWHFLWSGLENRPVRWRDFRVGGASHPFGEPDFLTPYDGSGNNLRNSYGINTTLLPIEWQLNANERLPRGVILTWGLGMQPNSSLNYVTTLMWHPSFNPSDAPAGRRSYGFTSFVPDPDPLTTDFRKLRDSNLFGSGMCVLEDGKLVAMGGSYSIGGALVDALRGSYLFNPERWNQGPDYGWTGPLGENGSGMNEFRRYVTTLTLPNGKILAAGGTKTDYGPYACNDDYNLHTYTHKYEIFDPATMLFTPYDLVVLPCVNGNFQSADQRPDLGKQYPRMSLISWPNGNEAVGRVARVGPDYRVYLLDPDRPELGWARQTTPAIQFRTYRGHGNAVLLPRNDSAALNPTSIADQTLNQMIVHGGSNGCLLYAGSDYSTLLTFGASGVNFQHGPSLAPGRRYINSTILPDGSVLLTGGMNASENGCPWSMNDMLFSAYLLKPDAAGNYQFGHWAPAKSLPNVEHDLPGDPGYGTPDGVRIEHSSAILLPDARVLSVGTDLFGPPGGPSKIINRHPLVYNPPYLYNDKGKLREASDRPAIVGRAEFDPIDYGEVFEVGYYAPPARKIKSVILMRPGAGTHSSNFEQRLVRCSFKQAGERLDVTAPWSNYIAPPGWYMMFLIDTDNVPSTAGWVRLANSSLMSINLNAPGLREGAELKGIELAFVEKGSDNPLHRTKLPALLFSNGSAQAKIQIGLPTGEIEVRATAFGAYAGTGTIHGDQIDVELIPGDTNKDGQIDDLDLAMVLEAYGLIGQDLIEDLDRDGSVNDGDVQLMLNQIGR